MWRYSFCIGKMRQRHRMIESNPRASRNQMRNAQSVMNHLNFCMMAATATWLYAIHLEHAPERRHIIRGRSSFAFSDIRHIIAKTVLSEHFDRVCSQKVKPAKNLPVAELLRMVA